MTSPANNATVPSRTVTFTGTGAPGSTVSILDAAGAALSGTSPSTVSTGGTWSLTATFAPTVPVTVPLVASQKTGGAASGTASFTIHLPAAPAIALSTSAAPTSFTAPGQAITFRYLVTNTGDVALTSIGVTDDAIGPGGVQCPASTLAPGAGETCTRSYTTTQANVDAGSITSSATATGRPTDRCGSELATVLIERARPEEHAGHRRGHVGQPTQLHRPRAVDHLPLRGGQYRERDPVGDRRIRQPGLRFEPPVPGGRTRSRRQGELLGGLHDHAVGRPRPLGHQLGGGPGNAAPQRHTGAVGPVHERRSAGREPCPPPVSRCSPGHHLPGQATGDRVRSACSP